MLHPTTARSTPPSPPASAPSAEVLQAPDRCHNPLCGCDDSPDALDSYFEAR